MSNQSCINLTLYRVELDELSVNTERKHAAAATTARALTDTCVCLTLTLQSQTPGAPAQGELEEEVEQWVLGVWCECTVKQKKMDGWMDGINLTLNKMFNANVSFTITFPVLTVLFLH